MSEQSQSVTCEYTYNMSDNKSTSGKPWNGTDTTWVEIAKQLGVSRQRVNQIHSRMLERIKEKLLEVPEVKDWLLEEGLFHDDENK